MEHRRRLAWIALAVAVMALRLPMIFLPGLGRDEATYLYWSHHPEPAYAPLLQLLVALTRELGSVVGPRLPSVVAGAVVLVLFERLLCTRGIAFRDRWIAVALVGFCPWQTYAGSILHPDDLQLAAALGFVLAATRRHGWWAVVIAGLAPWAKPSGILISAVGAVWVVREGFVGRRRAPALAALAGIALAPLFAFDTELVRGLLSFGTDATGPLARLGVFVVASLLLAGPVLPWVGIRGLVAARTSRDPGTLLGLLFVAAFTAAALVSGQVKGNWMLPAILLLWPASLRWRPRPALVAVVSTASLAAIVTLGFVRVDWTRSLEERWTSAPSYLAVAGDREADVASASAWWHRLAEYRAFDPECPRDAAVVVSDDYGLAAQWVVRCPDRVPRLVLPLDPIFAARGAPIPRGALVVAVRHPIDALVGDRTWEPLDPVAHPITGDPILRARVTDDPPAP